MIVDIGAKTFVRVFRPNGPGTDFPGRAVDRRPGFDLRDPVSQQGRSAKGAVLDLHRNLLPIGREDFKFRARRHGAGDLNLQHLFAVRSRFRSENGRAALLVNDAAVKRLGETEISCRFSAFRGGSIFGSVHCMTNTLQAARGESDRPQKSSS